MTDDQVGPLNGSRTPPHAESPRKVDTLVTENIPHPSKSPYMELDELQHGCTATSQQELRLKDRVHAQDHYSDDLGHRIKDMWLSRSNESDDSDTNYGTFRRRASETEPGCRFPQAAYASENINDYEKLGSLSRDLMADSHDWFQQPFTLSGLAPTTKPPFGQSVYYQDRLDLADQGQSINTPVSYDTGMGDLDPSFDRGTSNYGPFVPTTAPFQDYTASANNVPVTSLSSNTNLSFYEAPSAMNQDREGTVHFSEGDVDPEYKDDAWWQDQLLGDSPSSMEAPGSKVDEPYAQLIYRAFISRPNKSMTLQDIYQWFRENTDKSKSEGKGWQNSIRHNLSMNGAFTKRNSKTPLSGNGDGSVSLDNAGVDGRKSTEWFLEPAFYAGVESTTRYRKGNSGSRSRGMGSNLGRSRLGSDGHGSSAGGSGGVGGGGAGFSHARVSAGRKGGNVAAQNRKRLAERQQQHARQVDMARANPRHLQQQQHHHQGYNNGSVGVPYGGGGGGGGSGGFDEGAYYPPYSNAGPPHLAPSPFPPGFSGVPAAIVQGQGTQQQTDMAHSGNSNNNNGFNSDDVGPAGRDAADVKCSRVICSDAAATAALVERNEPLTPPGSDLEPPRTSMDSFGGSSSSSKHREYLPELTGFYNPLNSYHMGVDFGQYQHQHSDYTSESVAGVYKSPAGGPQPPLFVDEDISLSPDGALLMNLNFGE
ncbi:hypothetical protein N0V82_008825 [Gnomoniopsis sp. IMI 355080]|nr:hypothetical protein N0V82_008825 [Gnomoniopsis sp. IMI 355080]